MIDVHSHILPGVDDGAKDMDMSIEMARMYLENGYEKVIATPHWIEHAGTANMEENSEVLSSLQEALEQNNIPLEVRLGNEFFIAPDLFRYVDGGEGAAMSGSSYILIELPIREYPRYTESVLFDLQLKGYRPIIAHPERYEVFREDPNKLRELIKKGIYTQMNFHSITGLYGKEVQKQAVEFLEHGFIHMIGTDAHSSGRRSPDIGEAYSVLEELVGKEEAVELTKKRAEQMIEDRSIAVPETTEIKRIKWYEFWKR